MEDFYGNRSCKKLFNIVIYSVGSERATHNDRSADAAGA